MERYDHSLLDYLYTNDIRAWLGENCLIDSRYGSNIPAGSAVAQWQSACLVPKRINRDFYTLVIVLINFWNKLVKSNFYILAPKITKLPRLLSMLSHHLHLSEIAFCWRAEDGPLIVVFGSSLPSIKKKNAVKVGPLSDKTVWIWACN